MPQYVEVKGNVVEFPDGMSAADIEGAIHANMLSIKPAAAVEAGKQINSIPRQLGLTARYALEGPAQAAQLFTEPIANLMRMGGVKTKPLGEVASNFADYVGLPKPEGANERVIGDAARLVAGSGGFIGAAGKVAELPGIAGKVGAALSANPGAQLASAGGAGLAGGASREAGGGDLMQAGASLMGGVAGGIVPGIASSVGTTAKRLASTGMSDKAIDLKINAILNNAGVDYSAIPNAVKQSLRNDLGDALKAGQEINPAAVARLADFRAIGATPTRGMVSLDPVQITKEQNLAKMAANSSDGMLQGLPRIQNQNNQTLIRNLNEGGALSGDPIRAGEQAIGAITGKDAALKQSVTSAYDKARSMPGGDIPLDRKAFIDAIYGNLAKQNKMAFLPDSVSSMLDTIGSGVINVKGQQHQVPFDANALDNLLTTIATAQRGTQDGNVKAALSAVRQAIDSTPISPVKAEFGGNQVVSGAGAKFLQNKDAEAGAFMEALNSARDLHRQRMAWGESAKPIEAALNGAQPDNFIKRFVIGGNVQDAQALAQNAPVGEIKNAIVSYLKEKALNGESDEVGKFSQSAFNKALNQIGDRKLNVFFSPEEIAQLKAVGRASSYMQAQPVGSAVNNSNSGALLLGKGLDFLDKVPIAGPMFSPALKNINVSLQTKGAENILPGLLATQPKQPIQNRLLIPGMAVGGLLAAP